MTITDETTELRADSAAPALATELPGPRAREIIARDEAVTSPSLTRVYPLVVRRARGCVIEDVDGNRFLDFNAGIAVVAAGHAHPAVNAAIHAQVEDVLHYWACQNDECDDPDTAAVNPSYYEESGTPVCENCCDDMAYIKTEVRESCE